VANIIEHNLPSSSTMASDLNHSALRFELNTGDKIPAIGCGTWHVKGPAATNEVRYTLQTGYRHIDTAYAYGNEKEVGLGIKESGVPREDIWITSKISCHIFYPPLVHSTY